ncbi:MAG: DUF6458 family protein [Nocardioides sp.]
MNGSSNGGLGLGVALVTVGAILTWALQVSIPYVDRTALGVVLMVVGVVAIILSVVMDLQRGRSRHVVEHRSGAPVERFDRR